MSKIQGGGAGGGWKRAAGLRGPGEEAGGARRCTRRSVQNQRWAEGRVHDPNSGGCDPADETRAQVSELGASSSEDHRPR